jgi:NlpC/P60 family putative phage cell wall peptidase
MTDEIEAAQREMVAREALSWVGTPYHHHARIKGVGVDCAQLLCGVFEACALVSPIDPGIYAVDWHLHRNEEMFSAWCARYAKLQAPGTPLKKGDVCLFKFGRTFSHGSIYVGDGVLVHAYIRRGVILSRATEDPLDGRDIQHWSFW